MCSACSLADLDLTQLTLLLPPPPLWLIFVVNIIAVLLIIGGFVFIIVVKRRPFCTQPSSRDLQEADKFQPRRGAVGKVISKQGTGTASVKNGFSFKDHGDDIGTDMSEEKGPHSKPETPEEFTAAPFDPAKVARAMVFEEKAEQKRGFGEDFNLYGDAKRISYTQPEPSNNQTEPGDDPAHRHR